MWILMQSLLYWVLVLRPYMNICFLIIQRIVVRKPHNLRKLACNFLLCILFSSQVDTSGKWSYKEWLSNIPSLMLATLVSNGTICNTYIRRRVREIKAVWQSHMNNYLLYGNLYGSLWWPEILTIDNVVIAPQLVTEVLCCWYHQYIGNDDDAPNNSRW